MDEQEESEVMMCSDQMKPSASIEFFRWLGNGMISRLRHRSGVVSLAGPETCWTQVKLDSRRSRLGSPHRVVGLAIWGVVLIDKPISWPC